MGGVENAEGGGSVVKGTGDSGECVGVGEVDVKLVSCRQGVGVIYHEGVGGCGSHHLAGKGEGGLYDFGGLVVYGVGGGVL